MMDFDDATVRGELTDPEWREIQALVQTSFAMLAPQLGSRTEFGRLLASEMEQNPLYQRLSPSQRFRMWQYTYRLVDFAYLCTDDSDS